MHSFCTSCAALANSLKKQYALESALRDQKNEQLSQQLAEAAEKHRKEILQMKSINEALQQ